MTRRNNPDRILVARLSGAAVRLARNGDPIDGAIAELRHLAAGRADLLAETAGTLAGYWSVEADTGGGDDLTAVSLLITAGADPDLLDHWVDVGRQRARAPRPAIG